MLIVSKKDGAFLAMFEDYRKLYLYITHKENLKLLEGYPEFTHSPWSFLCLTPEIIDPLIKTLEKNYNKPLLLEAWRKQLPILEICEGDYQNIAQMLITPNLNIEGLREDWCLAYCEAHDMTVTEPD